MLTKVLEIKDRQIVLGGHDMFGRQSDLLLRPAHSNGSGWFIKQAGQADPMVICPDIAHLAKRRLFLDLGQNCRLEVYEHLGALRFLGLGDLELEVRGVGPYYGSAWSIWEQIRSHCVVVEKDIPYYTVNRSVEWSYPTMRGGMQAFTKIKPLAHIGNQKHQLLLDITVSYPDLGQLHGLFHVYDQMDGGLKMEKVLQAKTMGRPACLYWPSLIGSCCRLWPHHREIIWKHDLGVEKVLEQALYHRAQDLLGAMSLLCCDGLLAGVVVSVCSGHEADWHAIKLASNHLIRINN